MTELERVTAERDQLLAAVEALKADLVASDRRIDELGRQLDLVNEEGFARTGKQLSLSAEGSR